MAASQHRAPAAKKVYSHAYKHQDRAFIQKLGRQATAAVAGSEAHARAGTIEQHVAACTKTKHAEASVMLSKLYGGFQGAGIMDQRAAATLHADVALACRRALLSLRLVLPHGGIITHYKAGRTFETRTLRFTGSVWPSFASSSAFGVSVSMLLVC